MHRSIRRYKIWLRLVVSIWLLIALAWGGMLVWASRVQRATAIEQAHDFANSVHQMTLAGLTGMMITGTGAQRAVFLEQIRQSDHIRDLRVQRGEPVARQFGPGSPDELATDPLEREVLRTGKAIYELRSGPGGEVMKAVMPAIALTSYLGKNCLQCHHVPEGTVLGTVSMELSLDKMNAAVRDFSARVYWAAFLVSVPLILVIYYLVSRSVTLPLAKMTAALRKIAKGDVRSQGYLDPVGRDEIAEATQAFNAVMEEVKDLLHSERLASGVFASALDGIVVCDAKGYVQLVNPAFTATTGYRQEEVVGKTLAILKSGRQDAEFYRQFWEQLTAQGSWQGELWNRRKNGQHYPERLNVSAVRDERGEIEHYIGIFSDITDQKRHEAVMAHQAYHDALTGLPNRKLFEDRLERALSTAQREGRRLAVLFIDLDRFKFINDTHGHAAGDQVLKEVARRLRECVRNADTVARLGGDEFTILLPEIADAANAAAIGAKILAALKQPCRLHDRDVSITGSIGISLYPEHGADADGLMKKADAAMYHVKEGGRAGQSVFCGDFAARPEGPEPHSGDLERALEKGEIGVFYQPQVSLETRAVVGLEALARWQHPQRGVLIPADFLRHAEDSDLIVRIGAYVLRRACQQAAEWSQPGLDQLIVAVNLAPRQFADPDLIHMVRDALLHSGLAPERLELEISESLALRNLEETLRTARALTALGVRLAICDFGSAIYSRGEDLSALRIRTVKIDRALVRDIGSAPWPVETVAGLIEARRVSGARIVALGVERAEQIARLRDALCSVVQGHLVSKALAPEEVPSLAGKRFDF